MSLITLDEWATEWLAKADPADGARALVDALLQENLRLAEKVGKSDRLQAEVRVIAHHLADVLDDLRSVS